MHWLSLKAVTQLSLLGELPLTVIALRNLIKAYTHAQMGDAKLIVLDTDNGRSETLSYSIIMY